MTIDNLIQRLEWFKSQVGGGKAVKVVDAEGTWGFMLHVEDVDGAQTLLIDVTGDPEE